MKLKEKSHTGSKYLQLNKTKGLLAVLYRISTSQLGKNIMQYKGEQRKQTGKFTEETQMPKQMKRFSTSLLIMETQIKMRSHFSNIRLAKMLKYR